MSKKNITLDEIKINKVNLKTDNSFYSTMFYRKKAIHQLIAYVQADV